MLELKPSALKRFLGVDCYYVTVNNINFNLTLKPLCNLMDYSLLYRPINCPSDNILPSIAFNNSDFVIPASTLSTLAKA